MYLPREEAMCSANATRPRWERPLVTGWGFSLPIGSYFQLNKDTCHPWLTISEDGLTVVRSEKRTFRREPPASKTKFTRYLPASPLPAAALPQSTRKTYPTPVPLLFKRSGKRMQLVGRDSERRLVVSAEGGPRLWGQWGLCRLSGHIAQGQTAGTDHSPLLL